jgi:site-specific recombinase XerD
MLSIPDPPRSSSSVAYNWIPDRPPGFGRRGWKKKNLPPTGVRNRALVVLLWRAGLRISEALALMPKDLDATEGTIRVLRGKGAKSRITPLDPESFAVIEKWAAVREKLGISARRTLICTLKGTPVQTAYVRALLPRLAKRAGITKRCHPHGLRHSYACDLRREGIDVGVISKALGHSHISTTSLYLDHISPKLVIDTLRNRVWGGVEAVGAK